jgi:hypothetical protein
VTEQEWLESKEPGAMLAWLTPEERSVSLRTLRLFAVSCARNVVFGTDSWRRPIYDGLSVAERYADRQATARELATASLQMPKGCPEGRALWGDHDLWRGVESLLCFKGSPKSLNADSLRDIIGNPFRPWLSEPATVNELDARPGAQIFLYRWSHANDHLAWCLADVCYEKNDWRSLPVIADALEDNGCEAADVLAHLRSPGPHARGCWALDLVLGKW